MDDDKIKIKKCLKSYLSGKKYFDTDKNKAFEFFKQSLKYLYDIKDPKHYKDIIQETETECNKYITLTVEQTIEKQTNIELPNIDLFEIIETGNISAFKDIKAQQLNFKIYNEEGDTPIHKAVRFGDTTFLKNSFKLGSSVDITNKDGYSALEIACLERDPNMMEFLLRNGADMKKHLFFRDGVKRYNNQTNYMDIAIILKIVLLYPEVEILDDLKFVFDFIEKDTLINLDDIKFETFIKCLSSLLLKINQDYKNTYLELLRDELIYTLKTSLGCPNNKLELLLILLIPFIEYPFNLTLDWYLNLELKYIIIKLLKKANGINTELKTILTDYLWDNYIKTNIISEDYLGNLVLQWISKIKV